MPDEVKGSPVHQRKAQAEGWAPGYTALLYGTRHAFARWQHSLFALFEEMTRFAASRLQEDTAAWWRLSSCRDLTEVVNCQQRFAAKVTEDYAEEITKLSQILMKATQESFSSVQQPPAASG
jgi:hypothetical protein